MEEKFAAFLRFFRGGQGRGLASRFGPKHGLKVQGCLLGCDALSPHKTVNWPPVGTAEFFHCLFCSWR